MDNYITEEPREKFRGNPELASQEAKVRRDRIERDIEEYFKNGGKITDKPLKRKDSKAREKLYSSIKKGAKNGNLGSKNKIKMDKRMEDFK